jgi:hypothetical protein
MHFTSYNRFHLYTLDLPTAPANSISAFRLRTGSKFLAREIENATQTEEKVRGVTVSPHVFMYKVGLEVVNDWCNCD